MPILNKMKTTKNTINICRLQLLEVPEDIGGMSTLLREALEFPDEHQESIDATCDEVRTVAEETITDLNWILTKLSI